MKVIKDGKVGDPDKWEAEVTCKKTDKYDSKGCGAVLQAVARDLVLMCWRGPHFRHYYAAAKCPQCGRHNKVKVPDPIWLKLDTKRNREKAIFDGFSEAI